MNVFGDLFGNPYVLPMICLGVLAVLAFFSRSEKGKKIGHICIYALIISFYYLLIDTLLMPAFGLVPTSAGYLALHSILYLAPVFYLLWKVM